MNSRLIIILLYTFISLGEFNYTFGKNNNFNYNARNTSNYFSAIISFDNFEYESSQTFFKKIQDLEKINSDHSSTHIHSLINLGKNKEALHYSRILENNKKPNFESRLILGLNEFKRGNYNKAKFFFQKLPNDYEHRMVFNVLQASLISWTNLNTLKQEDGIKLIEKIPDRYKNFKTIQILLANCFYQSSKTDENFKKIVNDNSYNFSRYYFFYSNYYFNKKNKTKALEIIKKASKDNPNNLLINQFKKKLVLNEKNHNKFNCSNQNDILAEIFYVIANALSSQGNYKLSNFYVSLSNYLNPDFFSYNSLLAENYFILNKYEISRKIFEKLSNQGSVYKWYADKQIAFIFDYQKKEDEAIQHLTKSYEKINPTIYQTFDFANFLKNREKFEKSVKLYSEILSKINVNHILYSKVLDKRGTAYERLNKWDLGENDLLNSLKLSPNKPYVMNYLAYTWIEKGKNLNKALKMLKKANEIKKNDGYITDSLGWALYKLNRFSEAKEYLKLAIVLMPTDPIVNDHFADCLWKNNEKIQARYYWSYVLKLETIDEDLKNKIKKKLIFGLDKA